MSEQASQRWFATLIELALKQRIMSPDELLAHVTPEVMTSHLPNELMGKLLAAALASGTISPSSVLQTVTPELLARHLPLPLLWRSVSTAVERTPIPTTAISGAVGTQKSGAAMDGNAPGEER